MRRNNLRWQFPENRKSSQHNLDRQQNWSSNRQREQRTIFPCPRYNPDKQHHNQNANGCGREAMKLLKKRMIRSRVICLSVTKRPIWAAQARVGGENCATESNQKIGNYNSYPSYSAYGFHGFHPYLN